MAGIKDLWKMMDIEYSDYIRTTEARHVKVVQKIFKQLYDQGDIYKSEYEGLVLHALRILLDAHAGGGRLLPRLRPPRGTGEGRKLFLAHEQIPGLADRLHREAPGIHPAGFPRQ